MFDVDNVVLLMFITLIKCSNYGFLQKLVKLCMYKICIKSYMRIKQGLDLNQYFKMHKKILSIGIAFSFQRYHKLPINEKDYKLDYIITEKGIFWWKS